MGLDRINVSLDTINDQKNIIKLQDLVTLEKVISGNR